MRDSVPHAPGTRACVTMCHTPPPRRAFGGGHAAASAAGGSSATNHLQSQISAKSQANLGQLFLDNVLATAYFP